VYTIVYVFKIHAYSSTYSSF